MRNITQIQQFLVAENIDIGPQGIDGRFGYGTLNAVNFYLMRKGKAPFVGVPTLTEVNAELFPEEQPAPKPKPTNPLTDWLISLAIKKGVNHLKGNAMLSNLFSGQKTIIVGVVSVLSGVLSLAAPIIGLGDVPGFNALSPGEAWTAITTGFGLIFLRQGIAKAAK